MAESGKGSKRIRTESGVNGQKSNLPAVFRVTVFIYLFLSYFSKL
jgi:hypothetical protein